MNTAITRRQMISMAGAALIPYQPRSVVALVQGDDRRQNIRRALEAIDDQIRPALRRKKYVLIKPNCVIATNQLGSTHVSALHGILDYLEPRFKGPVVIAESSRDVTVEAYENFHYGRLVAEHKRVSLVDLNAEESYEPIELVDANLHMMRLRLAKRMFDPDAYVIGSAILKAHDVAVATLSVKNMCLGAPLRSPRKDANRWNDKFRYHAGYRQMHMNIVLTAKRLRPYWGATVIDGYEGMEGDGPLAGTPVASRLAIASTDLVAADRVGVEAMGVAPEWVGYLNYCCDAGLGQYDLARIDIRGGVSLAAVRRKYKLHRKIEQQLEWMGPLPKA